MKAATYTVTTGRNLTLISIHAAREGGDGNCLRCQKCWMNISIHAAREGGDGCGQRAGVQESISIHAAREGGDVRVPL